MIINRNINGAEIKVELTRYELSEAHREFIINWMKPTCADILDDQYDYQTTQDVIDAIANQAYENYADEKGTEWECCEIAVTEWAADNIEEETK